MPRMRHAFAPSAERLEAHVLLSSVALATALSGPPITEKLTTDRTVYKLGQPIHIMLTETNNTNAAVTLPNIAHSRGFTATSNFQTVWVSGTRGQRAVSTTLEPAETRTIRVTWNGRSNVASSSRKTPLTGTFQIDTTLANNTVTIVVDPAHGKGSKAGAKSPLPDVLLTLAS